MTFLQQTFVFNNSFYSSRLVPTCTLALSSTCLLLDSNTHRCVLVCTCVCTPVCSCTACAPWADVLVLESPHARVYRTTEGYFWEELKCLLNENGSMPSRLVMDLLRLFIVVRDGAFHTGSWTFIEAWAPPAVNCANLLKGSGTLSWLLFFSVFKNK